MNVFRYWTGILIVLILAVIFAHPLTANAQVSRYCGSFTVPYGAEIPAPGTGVYSSKAECEGYFNKNCTPDGSVVGQGGYCCNSTGTYYLNGNNVYCGSCTPDGSIVGQGGRCCSRTSYQKGNNVYCGKSAVVATTCTVGGNTLTAGATACGANGDSFEYVCVATGNAVGSAVDDTGAATLQKRTCSSGWTCQGNACVAQNFSACTLPHGTLDTRANMFCCSGKYSATSCSGAQGYYLGGADLPDGTWCTPGDSNLLSGSGGCGRCASKTSSQRSDGKYYCGAAPRVYCNKICPSNSFCNADANGGVCKTSSLNATPGPTPNLQVDLMYTGPKSSITTGQACNDANGCLCTNQSSLAAPTTVKKGDVCGGASLPAGSAVCSGQCVSGNSCSVAGEQKGIGVCTTGFVCCATTLQTPRLTSQQSACIRNFNQTGLITQDGACGQTLVSKGIVTQTQLNQTAGSQIVVDLGLKAVVSQLDAAATSFERSQIMAKAYNEGKITLAEYTAATAYYATSTTMNALTGGAEYRFQNSVAFSKAQCAPTLASLDCATAVIGAAANGFVATVGTAAAVDQLIGSPLTNTLSQGIQSGLTSSATSAEAKAKALGQLDVTINPQTNASLPCVLGTSTDPTSIAFEGKKGKRGEVLGCAYDPINDALQYNVNEGVIKTVNGEQYTVGNQIGSGAYSTVYNGENGTVLKIFSEETITNGYAYDSALNQTEFLLGTKKTSGYPEVIRIIVDSEDSALLRGIEMQEVSGTNLGKYLSEGGTLTQDQADAIVNQLQSVQSATGRAHGDIAFSGQLANPDNIIIQPNGQVTFLDPAGMSFSPLDSPHVMQNELSSLAKGLQLYVR